MMMPEAGSLVKKHFLFFPRFFFPGNLLRLRCCILDALKNSLSRRILPLIKDFFPNKF
jgi:hypothetical protein